MNCKKTNLAELSAEILRRDSIVRFRARGGSMHPFIKDGDIVEVAPTTAPSIAAGDVVLFSVSPGLVFAHRVIKKQYRDTELVFLIKGDAKPQPDHEVYSRQVLGKVIAIERNGRRISLDRALRRFAGMLYARISPWSSWFYPILRSARRVVGVWR